MPIYHFLTTAGAILRRPLEPGGLERTVTMRALDAVQAVVDQFVGLSVAFVERQLILATLRETGGNRTHAASLLGISIRTLRNKITLYAADGYNVPEPVHPATQ